MLQYKNSVKFRFTGVQKEVKQRLVLMYINIEIIMQQQKLNVYSVCLKTFPMFLTAILRLHQ